MIIIDIQALKGPNRWSNYRKKLIILKLDIQEYEQLPTNLINGFTEALLDLIPTLANHHCSRNKKGGFIERLQEGTWLGHVVEHVALELQHLCGMDCTFGRTYATKQENVYNVIFSYELETAGRYAAKKAVQIVECLAKGKEYTALEKDIAFITDVRLDQGLGPSTRAIVAEAEDKNIPWHQPYSDSNIIFGYGVHQKKICAALSCSTSAIAVDLVSDKDLTKRILNSFHIPTPKGYIVRKISTLKKVLKEMNFPVVIKPINGNQGRGVTTGIMNLDQVKFAFNEAKKISSRIIVEEYIPGFDFRFLVVNYKLVAIARRKPASILGDGVSTIESLIKKINDDPRREDDHGSILTKIRIDDSTLNILEKDGLSLDSVLPNGQEVFVKYTANLSTGGTAIDVTDAVHPQNKWLAERIAKIMNLDICGVDIIAKDIRIPISKNNGAIIEVNAAPGLRMHFASDENKERHVAKHIVEHLYPEGKKSRIPITAVTGTNGKTTTVRLLAYFAMQAGHQVGCTTTDGVYINQHQIRKGDCSGPKSAASILYDPTIDFAVLECARGGILNSGLGFDHCNISIVTNITEDHLGLGGIDTLEELAEVKRVVPMSTLPDGYAILNADDDLVYKMKDDLTCQIALFSLYKDNARIEEHCLKNGLAIYLDEDHLVFRHGNLKNAIINVKEIPITYNGEAKFMIQNIMPAVLSGILHHFEITDIASWLRSFLPSIQLNPGRMNMFDFEKFKIMVDYGHNTGAFIELKKFIKSIQCHKKVGIIGTPGNRRNEDIVNIGFHAAEMFDEIIIRHDKNGRGRTNEEITHLLQMGIQKFNPLHNITIISDEKTAVEFAIQNAVPDSFISLFPEDVSIALEHIEKINLGMWRMENPI